MAGLQLAPGFEETVRARLRTPEGEAAMQQLLEHIAKSVVETFPPDLLGTLDTPEGRKAFETAWPGIVEAYFRGLRNPKPK